MGFPPRYFDFNKKSARRPDIHATGAMLDCPDHPLGE
jgi:hypothetical protein